ncbi:MAG: hypothetical protein Q9213_007183 [Squamulea squamosa]
MNLVGRIQSDGKDAGSSSPIMMRSDQYVAVGCDLRDIARLSKVFDGELQIGSCLVLCTAEVSITYMDVDAADALIKWAAQYDNMRFCVLEQILPQGQDHPFAQKMMQHFVNLGTPLRCVQKYPLLEDQERRFIRAGYHSVKARTLWHIWQDQCVIAPDLRLHLNKVEPFDEWEEFALFSSHYFILEARKSATSQSSPANPGSLPPTDLPLDGQPKVQESGSIVVNDRLALNFVASDAKHHRKYGATIPFSERTFGLHGGFGDKSRLNTTARYQDHSQEAEGAELPSPPLDVEARVCHTITALDHCRNLLAGGRTSPDNALSGCWLRRSGQWKTVDELPIPLYRHCATTVAYGTVDSGVLVFGGRSTGGVVVNTWFLWREMSGWEELFPSLEGLQPRFGAVMASTSPHCGILFGGMTEEGILCDEIWAWTIFVLKSTPIDTDFDGHRPLLVGHAVGASGKTLLIAGGGAVTVHQAQDCHMNFQTKNFRYVKKRFGEFIQEACDGSPQYLRSLNSDKPAEEPARFYDDFPGLQDQFRLPQQLETVVRNEHSSPLRMSGPVNMWLHYDVMANVLCQIMGTKVVALYPPMDAVHFKIPPAASSSPITVFDPDKRGVVNYARHHIKALLKQGDVLYIPPLWLHSASPLDNLSVSINVFFRNLKTGYTAGRDVYGNRDLQAYENGRRSLERIVKSMESLPRDVGSTYLALREQLISQGERFAGCRLVASNAASAAIRLNFHHSRQDHLYPLAMRRHASVLPRISPQSSQTRCYSNQASTPLLTINNATFYRQHPTATEAEDARTNPSLFPNLTFELPSSSREQQHWSVIGPSSSGKTTLFEIIRGQHLCFPPTSRSYPYLSSPEIDRKDHRLRNSFRAFQYVGFSGKHGGGLRGGNTAGSYLSARYESRREATDFTVLDYLKGNIELNPSSEAQVNVKEGTDLKNVIYDLNLEDLVDMPMGSLSNGQTRRAKIAKALLDKPEVLLLDEPFMGLDPPTMKMISPLLHKLAEAQAPRILLSLRPQEPIPEWITHIIHLGPDLQVAHRGPKREVLRALGSGQIASDRIKNPTSESARQFSLSREGLPMRGESPKLDGEPIVEMRDVRVKYGDNVVLGNWQETINGEQRQGLNWTVRRGERWGIFGPNGSGKTTLISLICSDHPQSYSLPIRLFSRPRLPQPGTPGISIFDLQSRIGHSSPETHNFFPKQLSLRRCIESAWSDTFLSPPSLTYERDTLVDTYLKWFEPDLNPTYDPSPTPSSRTKHSIRHGDHILHLGSTVSTDWADNIRFTDLPFSAQRLALFLRALIKKPDLVVLDEAFSGMDASLRDKCLLFLTWGTTKTYAKTSRKGKQAMTKVVDTPKDVLDVEGVSVEGLSNEQALIVVSHVKEEVPGLVRDWMCLPDAGTGEKARFGRFEGPLEGVKGGWEKIWGSAF